MSALIVTGGLEPVRPLAVRAWYMRSGEGDLAALKTITDAFPVPSWVAGGGGTINSQRANLTDDQVEGCIRDWIWQNVNYTGTDAGGTPPTTHRALDVYNWIITNAALNGGKGPTISCGTASDLYVGLLAAYGIPARRIWFHYAAGTAVDTTAEYWSPAVGGWVHVIATGNSHDQWTASGLRASALDGVVVARQTGSRVGIVDQVGMGGSNNLASRSGISVLETSYNDWIVWGRGNRLQFSGGRTGDPYSTEYGNLADNFVSLLDPTVSAVTATVNAEKAFVAAARDISDIAYTPNALLAYARLTSRSLAEVGLEAVTLDTGYTYQVKPPAGVWTSLPNPAHTFYPVTGNVWQYRAVGPLGNTTNTVSVTVP